MKKYDKDCFELFRVFSDGMILQRESRVRIWGFANCGSRINLEISPETDKPAQNKPAQDKSDVKNVFADSQGEFSFEIATGPAGGPYHIRIWSGAMEVNINDVLFGDVYFISGQSNMELTVSRTIDLIGEELPDINYPELREFRVPLQIAFGEKRDQYEEGYWMRAVGDDILKMSATGFNFARDIHETSGIPVGLINCGIGGTPIEAHLSEEILKTYGIYDEDLEKCKDKAYVKRVCDSDMKELSDWYARLNELDDGLDGDVCLFTGEAYDDSDWAEMDVPVFFGDTEIGEHHGSIWFRKEFYVPDNYLTEGALLRLGTIIDADVVYLNGHNVGQTDYMYPPRRYMLPDGVLKAGRNVLTVRVIINRNTGGFTFDKRYCIQGREYIYEGGYRGRAENPVDAVPEKGRYEIDLSGKWRYKMGPSMEVLPMMTFFQYKPAAIYNGMTHALRNYTFKGSLWYQGESNEVNANKYCELFEKYVYMLRQWFGDKLPVYFVQLPQFDDPARVVAKDSWAMIREQQRLASRIPDTAMAVTFDIGEANDLHPQNKRDVGKRLAALAKDISTGTGPLVTKATYNENDNTLVISFSHCDKLVLKNCESFEVSTSAGSKDIPLIFDENEDKKWKQVSDVSVKDNTVVIKGLPEKVKAVRYCYDNCPYKPSIYDMNGLPASPFVLDVVSVL